MGNYFHTDGIFFASFFSSLVFIFKQAEIPG